MYMERYLRGIAGLFVLVSIFLAYVFSDWWLLLGSFVGINLFQSAFSNWCPMVSLLRRFGVKSCEAEMNRIKREGTV